MNQEKAINLRPWFRQWCDEQQCYTTSPRQKLPFHLAEYLKLVESRMYARTFADSLSLISKSDSGNPRLTCIFEYIHTERRLGQRLLP